METYQEKVQDEKLKTDFQKQKGLYSNHLIYDIHKLLSLLGEKHTCLPAGVTFLEGCKGWILNLTKCADFCTLSLKHGYCLFKIPSLVFCFFCLLVMFIGNTHFFYILGSVWSEGFYVLLPSSICWTTASCNINCPFLSVSFNAYLYFT